MRAILDRLKAAAPALLRDAVGLLGVAAIAYGAALIYRPAAFIVAGLFLVVWAVIAGRNAG